MAKIHYATIEEINALMESNKWDRQTAEFYLIDKYDEVVFPDEDASIVDEMKSRRKIANVYDNKKGKRTRTIPPDEDKRAIITTLTDAINTLAPSEVVNPERQIDFTFNGAHYSVTLTKHRPKKG